MGVFLLWATWAHEYTSETASNPEGVFAPLCQSHPGLAVATKPTANPTGFLLDCCI